MHNTDYYELLGVSPNASEATIRAAYKVAIRQAHPDAGGDTQTAAAINEAFEVLSNEQRRTEYDNTRTEPKPSQPQPASHHEPQHRASSPPVPAPTPVGDSPTAPATPIDERIERDLTNTPNQSYWKVRLTVFVTSLVLVSLTVWLGVTLANTPQMLGRSETEPQGMVAQLAVTFLAPFAGIIALIGIRKSGGVALTTIIAVAILFTAAVLGQASTDLGWGWGDPLGQALGLDTWPYWGFPLVCAALGAGIRFAFLELVGATRPLHWLGKS